MSKKTAPVWMLVMGLLLVACGPAEPEVDTQATAVAAGVSATLTAQAPPPTVIVVVTPPPPTAGSHRHPLLQNQRPRPIP